MFFKSKHSLGFPIGSGAIEVMTCAGKAAGRAAGRGTVPDGPLTGKVTACCAGADPLSTGAPIVPAIL